MPTTAAPRTTTTTRQPIASFFMQIPWEEAWWLYDEASRPATKKVRRHQDAPSWLRDFVAFTAKPFAAFPPRGCGAELAPLSRVTHIRHRKLIITVVIVLG